LKLSPQDDNDGTYLREIENLKECEHKNIIKLIEVVTNKNCEKFLVFEYCSYDLKTLLSESAPIGISIVKSIMHQLFAGLTYLHTKGILHRDVKPDNLLIDADGILKIADFGSSRRIRKEVNYTPGLVTLRYRAPEIFLGCKDYTTAVDIWSSGCLVAELLVGKPLLDGTSDLEQIDKMCTTLGAPTTENWPSLMTLPNAKNLLFPKQPVNYLRKLIPNLSVHAYDLINRLLTYDPVKRITALDAVEHPFFYEEPLPSTNALLALDIVEKSRLREN